MGRLIKLLFILILLGFVGLTGFAYLGDLSPDQKTVTEQKTLNVD